MSEPHRGGMGRLLRPVRGFFARLSLVDQEAATRARDLAGLEERLGAEMARLHDLLARTQRENAAILRLLSGEEHPSPGGQAAAPVSRQAVFQEIERGSRAEIMGKLAAYVGYFRGRDPVVDLGCGRGEFLQLAEREGIAAYGVDSDADAVAGCRASGLDAREEDLMVHVRGLPAGSMGGIFCSQVVEHLPPDLLPDLLREVARALRPGGVTVIETPNPGTLATHVHSFWRDPTHIRPVPEPTLSLAARSAGLVVEEVVWASPLPEEERLQPVPASPGDPEVRAVVDALNAMTEKLNGLLYGFQDYALVATKPA